MKPNPPRGPDQKPRKGSPRLGKPKADGTPPKPEKNPHRRARKALVLSLLAQGKRPVEIHRETGIGVRTIYTWMHDEDFAAELDTMLEEGRKDAVRFVRAKVGTVARSLVRVALKGGKEDGPKVKAAELALAVAGITTKQEHRIELTGELQTKSDEELEAMVLKGAEALAKNKGGTE